MVAICVDDHPIQLYGLKNSVCRALPDCRVYVFTETREAIACAMKYGCDVLLCEIELYNGNGIQLAEEIQKASFLIEKEGKVYTFCVHLHVIMQP